MSSTLGREHCVLEMVSRHSPTYPKVFINPGSETGTRNLTSHFGNSLPSVRRFQACSTSELHRVIEFVDQFSLQRPREV